MKASAHVFSKKTRPNPNPTLDYTGVTVLAVVKTCSALNVKYLMRNYGRTRFHRKNMWLMVEPRLPHSPSSCDHRKLYDEVVAFMIAHDPRIPVGDDGLDLAATSVDDFCTAFDLLIERRQTPLMLPFVAVGSVWDYWGKNYFSLLNSVIDAGDDDPQAQRLLALVGLDHELDNRQDLVLFRDDSLAFMPVTSLGTDGVLPATLVLRSSIAARYCAMQKTGIDVLPPGTVAMRLLDYHQGGQREPLYLEYEREAFRSQAYKS